MSDLEKRVVDFLFDRLTGMENRVEALEKRLHHVEDKVSEILQRGGTSGTHVSPGAKHGMSVLDGGSKSKGLRSDKD